MELLGKIRRMHVREKISERAIAKHTGLSRNTVRIWLQTPEEVKASRYVRAKKFGKLADFTLGPGVVQSSRANWRLSNFLTPAV